MTALRVAEIDDALVVPPVSRETAHLSGVMAAGQVVNSAITWRGQHPMHDPPHLVPAQDMLGGTWLWGGPLYRHFGHFLTETATRLWAYDQTASEINGVVFTPKRYGQSDEILAWQRAFYTAAGVKLPIRVITTPTNIRRLFVPEQGFGLGGMAAGSTEFGSFIQKRFARDILADGPERLYLSRSRFGPRKGGILGEDKLEAYLIAEGYEIYHPETRPLQEQIAHLKAAKRILGADGSAFHLAGMVAAPDARAAMIMRRNVRTASALITQFRGLRGMPLRAVNAIRNDWTPRGGPPDRLSFAELDFAVLARGLRRAGMIDGQGWQGPPATDIRSRLRQISRARGIKFRAVAAAPRVHLS